MEQASWRDGNLLAPATARTLATESGNEPTGAGIFVHRRGSRPPYLYHEGADAGFRSILPFAADASFGVALTTNGEGGRSLIPEFPDAICIAHGQEPFRPAN